MKKNIAVLVAAFAVLLVAAKPSSAATEIYFNITEPPIPGEVTAKAYHNQIQLLSFTQSVQAPAAQGSGAGGLSAGKGSCGPITMTKYVDKSSPLLIKAVMTGEHIQNAVVSFVDTQTPGQGATSGRGGARNDYTVTLTDALFTSVQQSDASPAELIESVSLVASQFTITYVPTNTGGAASGPVTVNVNCATNTVN